MTPRHRLQPAKTGGSVRRAAATSVLSALALTSVTITAAALTLTNGEPRPEPSAAAPATTNADGAPTLAPPVGVDDVPVGVPDIALVAADGPVLDDIPTSALAAYQRAEAVLAEADQACHLDWTLIAAVGQVVSGHGSTAGSELDARGAMRPQYVGKPLKGDRDKRIPDSDAGRLDGDPRFDRPVGPMQLSPATWAVVGVDADGDGKRNPHDIDDAALSVSVLLCSGDGDLRKRSGRVDGVGLINDDRTFIETVLAVDRAYRLQRSAAPDEPIVVPSPAYVPSDLPTDIPTDLSRSLPKAPEPSEAGPTDPVTWSPQPTEPTDEPTDEPTEPTEPTDSPTDEPTDTPTDDPTDVPCPTDVPEEPTDLPTSSEPGEPTDIPTDEPTDLPTDEPTDDETDVPSDPGCSTDPETD